MEPILKSHFVKFKSDFEIETGDDVQKEAGAFERFVNYVLLSLDYPDVFTADTELLDFVSVGGSDDTFIDGIGITVNDRLIRSIEEIEEITDGSRKLNIDFVFVQSKMRPSFEMSDLSNFGTGVKHFFSEPKLPENGKIADFRKLKDYIYSNEKVISKLQNNPSLQLYFVGTGIEPDNAHFSAIQQVIIDDLAKCYFDNVAVKIVGGKRLVKYCRELANSFDVQIDIKDIFPLSVDAKADVKKAYAFTCSAPELLKVLTKDDGFLRRSLFNDNVRDYLGNQGAVNKAIRDTIVTAPEMFLLCNNGITIVCTGFEQIRDKLVRIENPQIVNGCQTCNTVFELRNHANSARLQLLVRVICTENRAVSNRIVRGTNWQNQVLEEAFEATLPFHQDTLEPFFTAYSGDTKLYYERRARQYNNDPLVKKTQIVNLRILTQNFVSIFLSSPHESHRHEAKLLEKYAGDDGTRKIFRDDHSPTPYFLCGLTWYMFEKYFREERISGKYKPYKAHLMLVFRYTVKSALPRLTRSRALESWCDKVLANLREPEFGKQVGVALEIFDRALQLWIERGGSQYGIKDIKEFTDLLVGESQAYFTSTEEPRTADDPRDTFEGKILRLLWREGHWFGFITRGYQYENVYFDSRGYHEEARDLVPDQRVRFVIGKSSKGLFARNVTLVE